MKAMPRLAAVTIVLAASPALAQSRASCDLKTVETVTLRAVTDGRTVLLADGREVRLAGIEVPPVSTTAGQTSKQALDSALSGQNIALQSDRGADVSRDRYGRLVAFAAVGERSVQELLLSEGHARVSANASCPQKLQAAETLARTARRGLWSDPAFAPVDAADGGRLLSAKGHFALAEGEVVSVHDRGATIYVNFSKRWSAGLTATILRRNLRLFSAAGVIPKQLEGKRIRVRGVIEQRGGPVIEAERPEQIEIVGG